MEIWKDVRAYRGLYEVSNLGRIKSLPKKAIGRNGSLRKLKERILKSTKNNYGYLMVGLYKNEILKLR